ncbi:unnamed protein product, partial [Chrysoparadoxa australica]
YPPRPRSLLSGAPEQAGLFRRSWPLLTLPSNFSSSRASQRDLIIDSPANIQKRHCMAPLRPLLLAWSVALSSLCSGFLLVAPPRGQPPLREFLLQDFKGFGPDPSEGQAPAEAQATSLGTLFQKEDEVIREITSDEYLWMLRDWAPIANFAATEGPKNLKAEAEKILTVLRAMQKWQPKRQGNFLDDGSKWSFGAPVGAFKGGELDAVACLSVSQEGGVVIEWITLNPGLLGMECNSAEWLGMGLRAIGKKRLEMPVT